MFRVQSSVFGVQCSVFVILSSVFVILSSVFVIRWSVIRYSLPALTLAYQTGRAVRQGCSEFRVLCSVFPACLDGHSRQAKDTKQINKNNSFDWFIQNINTIALVEGI